MLPVGGVFARGLAFTATFLADGFFAAAFFATGLFAAAFFAGAFFAGVFLTATFLLAVFLAVFFCLMAAFLTSLAALEARAFSSFLLTLALLASSLSSCLVNFLMVFVLLIWIPSRLIRLSELLSNHPMTIS